MTCFGFSKLVTNTKTDRFNFDIYHVRVKVSSQHITTSFQKRNYINSLTKQSVQSLC